MQGQEGDAGGTGEINASADVVTKRWGCKGGLDAGGKERAVGRQSDASLKCIYCGRHEAEEEIVKPRREMGVSHETRRGRKDRSYLGCPKPSSRLK